MKNQFHLISFYNESRWLWKVCLLNWSTNDSKLIRDKFEWLSNYCKFWVVNVSKSVVCFLSRIHLNALFHLLFLRVRVQVGLKEVFDWLKVGTGFCQCFFFDFLKKTDEATSVVFGFVTNSDSHSLGFAVINDNCLRYTNLIKYIQIKDW